MAITRAAVVRAQVQLDLMKGTLAKWLHFRSLNDRVLSGAVVPSKVPPQAARQLIGAARDMEHEQRLADQLHALLEHVMPNAALPSPDVASNPNAAAQLAAIAVTGQAPVLQASGAQALSGFASSPYMWPALIVGGLLVVAVTAIRSAAEVAMHAEEQACIQSGACTDYGFWIRAAGVVFLGWFAWEKLGVGAKVKRLIAKGGG